jgi:hypothetical protein
LQLNFLSFFNFNRLAAVSQGQSTYYGGSTTEVNEIDDSTATGTPFDTSSPYPNKASPSGM